MIRLMVATSSELKDKMQKALEALDVELKAIRTGRANPTILDKVQADYYGTRTPVKNMANISVSEGRTLVIQPFDRGVLKDIEKAIIDSGLGLTPNSDGNRILITVPELTGERRKELAKMVSSEGEKAKVSIRNLRRDAMDFVKKSKEGSEDDKKRQQDDIQKATDEYIKKIEEIVAAKEKEILTV